MKHNSHYIFFVLVSLILLLTAFLHPSISSLFLSFRRSYLLNAYMTQLKKTKNIDPQKFWQFREFYYPGSLTVDKYGKLQIQDVFDTKSLQPILFTSFKSNLITSNEYLINKNDLNYVIPFNENYTIYEENSIAFRENETSVELVFIKPISEMVKANGFFDYKDKDKELLKNKFWLVVTTIKK